MYDYKFNVKCKKCNTIFISDHCYNIHINNKYKCQSIYFVILNFNLLKKYIIKKKIYSKKINNEILLLEKILLKYK